MSPLSLSNMNRAGPEACGVVTTKSADPLKTCPVTPSLSLTVRPALPTVAPASPPV
jgi:hypothetical protein